MKETTMRTSKSLASLMLLLAPACGGTQEACPNPPGPTPAAPAATATPSPSPPVTTPTEPPPAATGPKVHENYKDDVAKLVHGTWSKLAVPMGDCADLVADDASISAPSFEWRACDFGQPTWSCTGADWSTANRGDRRFDLTQSDATWIGGKPHFVVRRSFDWGNEIGEDADLDTVQPLEGPGVYARLRGYLGKSCAGGLRTSDSGIADWVHATGKPQPGALLFWSTWEAPKTYDFRWFYARDFLSPFLESFLVAKNDLLVPVGNTPDAVFIDRWSGAAEKSWYPIQARTTENPLPWEDGVIAISRAFEQPDALYYFRNSRTRSYIDESTEGREMVDHRIDRTKGEVVWTERTTTETEGNTGLLKVARRNSLGGLSGAVVSPIPRYFRYGNLIANAGHAAFLESGGDTIVLRTTDGFGWRIPQSKGVTIRRAEWVDENAVWLGFGLEGGLGDNLVAGLVRIPLSSLGEATRIYPDN
jgi:hypothetical protein